MIVKTRNPIEYQNKNISNVETRGGYDGEDVGGFVSFNGDEFIPFDGQTNLDTFTNADGETYHYSFNNDEYYNAKGAKIGAKIKKFFSKEGFFGKEGKFRAKIKGLKAKIKARRATISANVKARQDARKVKKGAKKLIAVDVAKEKAQVKKDNIKGKADITKAREQVIKEKAKEKALKDISALAAKTAENKNANDQAVKDILNRKYDKDKEAEELDKQKAKYAKDKADEEKENKRIEDAKIKAIDDAIKNSTGGSGKTPTTKEETTEKFLQPLDKKTGETKRENEVVINGDTYDTKGNKNVEVIKDENGKSIPVINVPTGDVVATVGTDGNVDYYQKNDIEGMTLTTKILIGVGAVVVLGLITFLIIKRRK